jgi:UDP-2,3-diacylglucosamine pyrophosphatase LpxH
MTKKRKLDIVVISDVHLGSVGAKAKALNQYLKSIQPKILIINGDFIDGWNFKKKYFPEAHFEVIRRVIKMINSGTRVYYISGNHDEFIRKYNGLKLGNFSIMNQLELELNDKKMWFFHGDIFDASIQGRMKYLAKLGGKAYDLLIWSNRKVNQVLYFLGKEKMSFSKTIKNSVKIAVKWIGDFEKVASTIAIEKGFDYVICGHIHCPQIKNYQNEKGITLYLNSGDWVENLTSLEYSGKKWKIHQHIYNLFGEIEENDNEDSADSPKIGEMIEELKQIQLASL